jgi:hypothetical protein
MTLTLAPETEARVLAAAARRNETPEAIVDAAIQAHLRDELMQDEAAQEAAYQEEQARLRRLLLAATEEAKLVQPEPYDSPARTYYRESEVGKIIAEKFRKQGFNVD